MGEGGTLEKAKGRVKEAAGDLLDDDELKRKGRADQTAGKAKEKAEDVVDRVKEAVVGEKDS